MSVFTPLQREELEAFLAPYGLGRLRDFEGIAAGSENSNFFVSLERGEYVLTLIERGPSQDLTSNATVAITKFDPNPVEDANRLDGKEGSATLLSSRRPSSSSGLFCACCMGRPFRGQ